MVGAGCKTSSQIDQPQMFTVIGLNGSARYRGEGNNTWRTLKVGDHIPPTSVVQTASTMENVVVLAAGKRLVLANPIVTRPYDRADKLFIYNNSVLKINKLTAKTVREKKIWDMRLSLLRGTVLCDAAVTWPASPGLFMKITPGPSIEAGSEKTDFVKPEPNSQYYEIRGSNTVVSTQRGLFVFDSSGMTTLFKGALTLECTDTGVKKNLFALQTYNSDTKQIRQIEIRQLPSPDFSNPMQDLLRDQGQPPTFEVPRRPF